MPAPNRREFLKGVAAAPLMFQPQAHSTAESTLFLGTQTQTGSSKGIYAFTWNAEHGTLTEQRLAAPIEQPTYIILSADRRFLFAALELDHYEQTNGGGVASFRLGSRPGELTPINTQPSLGSGTCHVGVDPTGRTLICANYNGGSASSFAVSPDGHLGQSVSHFQYQGHGPNPSRQEAPHVHRATVSPGSGYALFNDLGLDCIHIYRLDTATAKLTAHNPPAWQAPASSGPRALRFHPNHRWAYCVAELDSAVYVLHWDEAAGALTTQQRISLKPEGFNGRAQASDIVIDRSGLFAYAACRFYDYLSVFSISPQDGRLTLIQRTSVGGKVPRDLALDPSERWLLCANQDSDTITIHPRDPKTGHLGEQVTSLPFSKPQCLCFVD